MFKPTLNPEQQKQLLDLLLTFMADTTEIKLTCLGSHNDAYMDLVDNFEALGLLQIKESWEQGRPHWKVSIEFRSLLAYLIDFNKIKYVEDETDGN